MISGIFVNICYGINENVSVIILFVVLFITIQMLCSNYMKVQLLISVSRSPLFEGEINAFAL